MDGFEDFVSTCLKYYNLDPCHYFSAPGLSWDVMLKMTKVEVEKTSDPYMHIFIEKCMRGGISCIVKGIVKRIMNIVQIMIKINLKYILITTI